MGMGERVRQLRKARRLTQRRLAKRAGMAPEQLNRYELERVLPSAATAARLALALHVALSDLLVEPLPAPRGEK